MSVLQPPRVSALLAESAAQRVWGGTDTLRARLALAWLYDRFPEVGGAVDPVAVAEHFRAASDDSYFAQWRRFCDLLHLFPRGH